MNSRLEDLMYRAGLTAQGCWDSMDDYDHRAIEKFALLIVRECIDIVPFAHFHKVIIVGKWIIQFQLCKLSFPIVGVN